MPLTLEILQFVLIIIIADRQFVLRDKYKILLDFKLPKRNPTNSFYTDKWERGRFILQKMKKVSQGDGYYRAVGDPMVRIFFKFPWQRGYLKLKTDA